MNENENRRNFLKIGLGTTGAVLASSSLTKAAALACKLTPSQTAGPFFPGEEKFHIDQDLTYVKGSNQRAKGQIVYIHGKILDPACNNVSDAIVEIWQACASGKYNNVKDTNPAPIDPNFKYWGEVNTNNQGEFVFKTIVPGAYPADSNWTRPPHIHFKVSKLGFHELITQMYFKGNPLNDTDLILQNIPASERSSVIVDFAPAPIDHEAGSYAGNFSITIRPVR